MSQFAPKAARTEVLRICAIVLSVLISVADDRGIASEVEGATTAFVNREDRSERTSERWRIEEDDVDVVFSGRFDVCRLEDASYGILDIGFNRVLLVNNDGSMRGEFGRDGEGPDDLRSPMAIASVGSDRIAVLEFRPARIKIFDQRGVLLSAVRLAPQADGDSGEFVARDFAVVDDGYLVLGEYIRLEGPVQVEDRVLAVFGPGGEEQKRIASKKRLRAPRTVEAHEENTYFVGPHQWTVLGRNAVVYSGDWVGHILRSCDVAGGNCEDIVIDIGARRRSDAELAEIEKRYRGVAERYGHTLDLKLSDFHQSIRRISRIGSDLVLCGGGASFDHTPAEAIVLERGYELNLKNLTKRKLALVGDLDCSDVLPLYVDESDVIVYVLGGCGRSEQWRGIVCFGRLGNDQ